LIVVRTANGQDSLWAMEEALKCRAGAVVADLWRTKAYDLVASRRLVLAAQKSGTPGLLVPAAAGTAQAISSAARTRFEVKAAPGRHAISAAGRTPLPGRAAWSVRVARIRAGPAGDAGGSGFGFDWEKFWPLVWDHEEAWFCDALPFPAHTPAFDRSPAPARGDAGGHSRVA
jgi:protein ImuA